MIYEDPRRGGPNGVICLGNNETDGKSWLANWNGISIGCYTRKQAEATVQMLRASWPTAPKEPE